MFVVYDANSVRLYENGDRGGQATAAAIENAAVAAYAFPLRSRTSQDAAMLVYLPEGADWGDLYLQLGSCISHPGTALGQGTLWRDAHSDAATRQGPRKYAHAHGAGVGAV